MNVLKYIRLAVVLTALFVIVTDLLYPGIVTGLAQLISPYQANGSPHGIFGESGVNVLHSKLALNALK